MQMKVLKSFLLSMFELVVKDFIGGILLTTSKDILAKFVKKTPWEVILERLLTRLLVTSLKWLSRLSTNQVWQDTVDDLLATLKGKGLKEAELPDRRQE